METPIPPFSHVIVFKLKLVEIGDGRAEVGSAGNGQKQKKLARALLEVNPQLVGQLVFKFGQVD